MNDIIDRIPNDATECRVYFDDGAATILIVEGVSLVAVDGARDRYHEVVRGPIFTLDAVPGVIIELIVSAQSEKHRWITTCAMVRSLLIENAQDEDWCDAMETKDDLLAGLR